MILNDIQIAEYEGMIFPYQASLVREVEGRKVISYGQSSFGYDIRLSPVELKVFRGQGICDPKAFDPGLLESMPLQTDGSSLFFWLPAHSYGLGVALEYLRIPNHLVALAIGKSTYARSGVIANLTPVEPGWHGHLTLEFANTSPVDVRLYANEGIAQLIFLEGETPSETYGDRKYQRQGLRVVPPLA